MKAKAYLVVAWKERVFTKRNENATGDGITPVPMDQRPVKKNG